MEVQFCVLILSQSLSIVIEVRSILNGLLVLLHIYLNFNDWENDFNTLLVVINENGYNNIITMGDLNGRI